jgi:site-specific recombinase XerD
VEISSTLRHTFLPRLGEIGRDALTLCKLAGHSSVTISQRYVHLSAERVADAVERLENYNAAKEKELSEGVVLQ